jgi:hypothetical protein
MSRSMNALLGFLLGKAVVSPCLKPARWNRMALPRHLGLEDVFRDAFRLI